MTFDYPGYDLHFVQRQLCRDGSDHRFTDIYKFHSPVTRYIYILRAEYHHTNVFAVKFYAKPHRHSDFKYNKIINRGDVGNILVTCAKVVPLLLQEHPAASFGFIGSRTIDKRSGKVESFAMNQRFRTYVYFAAKKFGLQTFAHFEYEAISGYLLVNRECADFTIKEREIVSMFSRTYQHLPDVAL